MSGEIVSWGLDRAREQTLRLLANVPSHRMCDQTSAAEHHPIWTMGHLLLGDSYLLFLLRAAPLPTDFDQLLARYGPSAAPKPDASRYDPFDRLVDRLVEAGAARGRAVRGMSAADLGRATPDPTLARAQPTIGHHLQALVCHEGYHAGELAAWRKGHGFPPVPWAFATPE